jgi:hypothetical protein
MIVVGKIWFSYLGGPNLKSGKFLQIVAEEKTIQILQLAAWEGLDITLLAQRWREPHGKFKKEENSTSSQMSLQSGAFFSRASSKGKSHADTLIPASWNPQEPYYPDFWPIENVT